MYELYRGVGAMLGCLVGDSILAKYETKKSAQILADIASRGGIMPHDYIEPFHRKRVVKAGQPTDDSELTAALALAMTSPITVDTASENAFEMNVYSYLRGFIFGHGHGRISYLTDGEAYGSGGTLRSALRAETYADSIPEFRMGRVKVLPTNGSLMRCAPIPLRYTSLNETISMAQRQSCVTHIHPHAQVSCIAYAVVGHFLLAGLSPGEALAESKKVLRKLHSESTDADKLFSDSYEHLLRLPLSIPTEAEVWPHTGDCFISLRIALAALVQSESLEEGIRMVAACGGDTDTYGAIAGSLMGMHYGVEGIPSAWLKSLQGADIMSSLAEKLHALAHAT